MKKELREASYFHTRSVGGKERVEERNERKKFRLPFDKVLKLKLPSCHSRNGLGIFELGRNDETHLPMVIVTFKSLMNSE